jgi:hypothetical protein
LGVHEIDLLEKVYQFVHKEIINPFSTNNMSVNDHAISGKNSICYTFSAYIRENYPQKKYCWVNFQRISIFVLVSCDDRFFTWQTNHGIMQLSLAQLQVLLKITG